jgi:hypothetical protein
MHYHAIILHPSIYLDRLRPGRCGRQVIFHQAQILLQHQILKYGSLIFEQNASERIKQETMARREYLDTRFLFKELAV